MPLMPVGSMQLPPAAEVVRVSVATDVGAELEGGAGRGVGPVEWGHPGVSTLEIAT